MRVLWFSNTPAAGDDYVSSNCSGGWLKSLDKAIQKEVELHVVFHDKGYPAKFKVRNTCYYCVAAGSVSQRIKDKIRSLFGKIAEVERCLDIVKMVKPDIVHIHGTEAIWIKTIAYLQDIPVVLSIQAIVTVMMHKYYSGIKKNETSLFSNYRAVGGFYSRRAEDERRYARYVRYILGRTEWDRRVYKTLAPNAQYFVCNEVLRDGFYNNQWVDHVREDNKIIVHTTTGTLLFKGLETVCHAVSLLISIGVNIEWRIAGVAENSEYVKIVRRAFGSNYPQKGLKYLGSLNEIELINKLLEAHIYVSPSHQDNSPNALCEATILGMPCISTCAGGSSTIVRDGITGIVIQDGDPWALAGAVIELADDRSLANKYAKEARKDALNRHNKDSIVKNLIEIYKGILNESNT